MVNAKSKIQMTSTKAKLSSDLRKILGNTSWLFAEKVLQMGLGLLVGVWVARYLGPNQFGIYNYAISLVGMLTPIVGMGLNSIVVRDISRDPSQTHQTLGTTFALSLIAAIVTLVLCITSISVLSPDDSLTRWVVGILAVGTIFQPFDVIDWWFQSQVQSRYIVISKQAVYLVACLLRFGLVQIQASLLAFAWLRLAELGISAIAIVVIYHWQGNSLIKWQIDWQRGKSLLKESFPLIFASLAISVYTKIDQIMLGSFLEDKLELGFYAVAVKLSEVFDFLPMILASSVLPKLSQLRSNEGKYLAAMQVYFDVMVLLWLVVAIPTSLLASWVVTSLYGDFYAPAGTILAIYVWGQFSPNLGLARVSYLTVENKLVYSLYLCLAGAVINIGLNLLLIPQYKAMGATIATLITYFTINVLANFLIRDLMPMRGFILSSLNLYQAVKRILQIKKLSNL